MKKFVVLSILILFSALLFTSTGWCLTLDDVGMADERKAFGPVQGSPQSELDWLNGLPNVDQDYECVTKQENVPYELVENTFGNLFAFELPGEPDYYILKNSNYVALFENKDKLNYAAFYWSDVAFMNLGGIDGPFIISHVTKTCGKSVPEPATIFLVGLGLVGLTGIGRKKYRK